jgi:alanine racemase
VTGAFGRSRPDLDDCQPPTLETLPEAVARNVAIARARTRARIMAVVKARATGLTLQIPALHSARRT